MWNQLDSSFKKLLNRVSTDSNKKYYEEFGDNTINIVNSEIWSTAPDYDNPSLAITNGLAQAYTLLALTEDITVSGQQTYFAGSLFSARLKNWISPKYGNAYTIKLYDNLNVQIDATNGVDWIFDYQTGILTLNGNTSGFSKPFRVSGWRYIGGFGSASSGNLYLEQAYTNQTVVTINHNWDTIPVVIVLDTSNEVVSADIDYTDSNNVTVTFFSSSSGNIILQSGLPSPIPISDAPFDSSWNGVSSISPSKNAVYDIISASNPVNSDVAYVNGTYGNDTTGIVGLNSNKYQTINAAVASSANIIIVEKGTYNENQVFKGSKQYILNVGVTIQSAGSISQSGFSGKVYGYGNFINIGSGALFTDIGSCYIEFASIVAGSTDALLTSSAGSYVSFVGKTDTVNTDGYANCLLGYNGVFGYPSSGPTLRITFTNVFVNSNIGSTALVPFNIANLDIRFNHCILKAMAGSSTIFGRYSSSATGVKLVLKNCYLLASGATSSFESSGSYTYVYLDNNTYANVLLDSNSGIAVGSSSGGPIINTNITNLY